MGALTVTGVVLSGARDGRRALAPGLLLVALFWLYVPGCPTVMQSF